MIRTAEAMAIIAGMLRTSSGYTVAEAAAEAEAIIRATQRRYERMVAAEQRAAAKKERR